MQFFLAMWIIAILIGFDFSLNQNVSVHWMLGEWAGAAVETLPQNIPKHHLNLG
jgi:hypothetical protein